MAGEATADMSKLRSLTSGVFGRASAARRKSKEIARAAGAAASAAEPASGVPRNTTEATAAGSAGSEQTADGLPDLAQELMARASDMSSALAEQQGKPALRDREEHTRRLLEAATLQADDAGTSEEEADVQLALMAAEMRVPSKTLASALQQGQPLPVASLPHSSPGKMKAGAVAARFQDEGPNRSFSDSGSWDQASRADSADSGWDSVGPLGGPQGSWEWFGSRGSVGSSGLPSNLRPVDDAVILERRRQGYVSLDTAASDGTMGDGNSRRRSASSVQGFIGAAGPDLQQAAAAAASTAANFRRVSEPGAMAPPAGLPPAAPPTAKRPNSGGGGSDAIRRASFGRAAAGHKPVVVIRPQLRSPESSPAGVGSQP